MKHDGRSILEQPQPHFTAIKGLFGHGCLGTSKSGRPIWVMRVGGCLQQIPTLASTAVLHAYLELSLHVCCWR